VGYRVVNDMESKISVIVPIYNSEKYIKNCIQSALKQTFAQFELILIDDGSDDRSGYICKNIVHGTDKSH